MKLNWIKNKKHNIEVVVDRLVLKKDDKDFESRLTQSIEAAIELSNGKLIVNDGKQIIYTVKTILVLTMKMLVYPN